MASTSPDMAASSGKLLPPLLGEIKLSTLEAAMASKRGWGSSLGEKWTVITLDGRDMPALLTAKTKKQKGCENKKSTTLPYFFGK